MGKTISLLLIFIIISACQRNEVIKTHGVSYLEKREKLIFVNKTNKNDTLKIFGQPSTKGMTDDNLWIYIERTITRGKLLKFGRSYIKKNNVLVLEFDKYGILKKKEGRTVLLKTVPNFQAQCTVVPTLVLCRSMRIQTV